MRELGAAYPQDAESQVFYALALLASASPFDKAHVKQKHAVKILEPLKYPQHPGIAHYLIHACDNQEMAEQGLIAARTYSKIAPSAPHALHMPSHIFTRLGLWEDSVVSNLAARAAAHNRGDIGEELHAMDYLVYAYLQEGREREANELIQQLKAMSNLDMGDFKIAYASTAIPVRYAVEIRQWAEAASIVPPSGVPPHVTALGGCRKKIFSNVKSISYGQSHACKLLILRRRFVLSDSLLSRWEKRGGGGTRSEGGGNHSKKSNG
jgi:hypothetical protein